MMFNQRLVATIKANGKILREFKDTVYVPFGSEYSILLKNLNTVRALVNVYIDGDNVVPGGLVLYAGQECDLERAIRNGNMNEGNKFKFIERTGAIENHRGIKLEDGLIRVEFQFEKINNYIQTLEYYKKNWPHDGYYDAYAGGGGTWSSSSSLRGMSVGNGGTSSSLGSFSAQAASLNCTVDSPSITQSSTFAPENETGITVAGSKSDQKFVTAGWFATEAEKHSIVLRLLGETEDNKTVRKPITVKTKQKCTTCGKLNKATSKFCAECGTALEIFA